MSKLTVSTTRHSFLQAFIIIVAMLIAISILNVAEKALRDAEVDRAISEAREKVLLDIKFLQKASVPEVHLGSYFYSRLTKTSSGESDKEPNRKKIKGDFEKAVKGWLHKPELFIFDYDQLRNFSNMAGKIESSDLATVKKSVVYYFCLKSIANLTQTMFSTLDRIRIDDSLGRRLDKKISKNQSAYCRSTLANFRPINIRDEEFFFAWIPLFKDNWEDSISRFTPVYVDEFDQRQLNQSHFRTVVAILIKAEDFDWIRKNKFKDILKYNFKMTGADLDFIEANNKTSFSRLMQNRIYYAEDENKVVGSANLLIDNES
ncbi:MAG: hypothetical protein ACQETH_17655, partial [Candidatus Rifleibacteriota bacterium]